MNNMTNDEMEAYLSSISLGARSLKRLADAAEKANEIKEAERGERKLGRMYQTEKSIKERTRGGG